MHDLLFERQEALERQDLERYAEEIGMDTSTFVLALDLRSGLRFDGTDLRELVPAVERAASRS
jgi:hypothetical protein